jgi:hypothetical protein
MSNTLTEANSELTPTIICVAESTHYLIGVQDSLDNLISLDKSNKIGMTSSLTEAKNYLRKHNIFTATLEYQTPYDEMCGLSPAAPCRQNITF